MDEQEYPVSAFIGRAVFVASGTLLVSGTSLGGVAALPFVASHQTVAAATAPDSTDSQMKSISCKCIQRML